MSNKENFVDKEALIRQIRTCENPYLLYQIRQLLQRADDLEPLTQLVTDFPILVQDAPPRDLRVITGIDPPRQNTLERYDTLISPFLYVVGLGMLVLAAALVNLLSHEGENISIALFQSKVAGMYLMGWSVFVLDIAVVYWIASKSPTKPLRGDWAKRLLVLVFPPLRIGTPHLMNPSIQWLPFKGWSYRNEGLLKYLKEKFSIPMIVIALLIIPVLIIEWKFYESAEQYLQTDLGFWLDMAQGFIWLAFTFEFILMLSISREKLAYAVGNWIDLLIILLPFVAFVRTIRLVKIARLTQVARGYKLRGLLMKARQGVLFAGFLYRIMTLKDFQVKTLKKKLDKNQQAREILEEELLSLQHRIAQNNSKSVRVKKV